jgi:hypothetical protein
MKKPIHYSISPTSKYLKSLIIFLSLGFFIIYCNTTGTSEKFILKQNNENYLFFLFESNDNKPQKIQYNSDFILKSLSSIEIKKKSFFGDNPNTIFPNNNVILIENTIQTYKNLSNTYLLIHKKEDLLNPYTRMYRDRLKIKLNENSIEIDFIEINRNLIFLTQFNLQDWGNPTEKSYCDPNISISISDKYEYRYTLQKSEFCDRDEKKIIFYNESFSNKAVTKEFNKTDFENRLKKLEELKSKNLISEDEYLEARKKILSDL